MPNRFERKSNTDNYQTRLTRLIYDGENLLQRISAPIESFDDLLARKDYVERWLTEVQARINSTYKNSAITSEFDTPMANAIIGKLQRALVQEVLGEIVSERIHMINNLIEETRKEDSSRQP